MLQEGGLRTVTWVIRGSTLCVRRWALSYRTCWSCRDLSSLWQAVLHHQLVALGKGGAFPVSVWIWRASAEYVPLAQCQNLPLRPSVRSENYMKTLLKREEEFEFVQVLTVSNEPYFVYYYDSDLVHDGSALVISHLSITEYVVIAVLRFLAAVSDGAVADACLDIQTTCNGCSVLVLSPSGASCEFDDIGFLEIIFVCNFELFASLDAYRRCFEVDRAWIEPAQRWNQYIFPEGHVHNAHEWPLLW